MTSKTEKQFAELGIDRRQTFRASAMTRSGRLVDKVAAACRRLAPAGWTELMALHGLDIQAEDLKTELARGLDGIDRSQPGFEDFAQEGARAVEPGRPSLSLLFHAFASPEVVQYRGPNGVEKLKAFPTPAEIEAVENYVFGSTPPSIGDLRARAEGAPLAIVVFASEYRPAADTVHRRHADMCYARTGIARIGTRPANYQPEARGFLPLVPDDGRAVAVQPCRYGAYIAALKFGHKGGHGPMRFIEPEAEPQAGEAHSAKDAGLMPPPAVQPSGTGDASRQFWIPLHKLFDGEECLLGYTIEVRLAAQHINEKIRRAHLFFGAAGHDSGWREPDIGKPPFAIRAGIAEFSEADGSWLLTPTPHTHLVEPAIYGGQPLTYTVPESLSYAPWRRYESSLNLKPAEDQARKAPEYLHARHKVTAEGEENLNESPNLQQLVQQGKYRARHYVDYTGDGWIDVECAALALEIPRRLPAYSVVASPDYFPAVRQSDLIVWTDQSAPPDLLDHIWPVNPGRPEPLSDQRFAANLELKEAGFNRADDTMTAIVGPLGSGVGRQMQLRPPRSLRTSMLPDGASGVFAPGWDVSFDTTRKPDDPDGEPSYTFLNNYGLGSPFPEDSMLCAALSSFWPAVAPDITRTFAPSRRYASSTPLTDDVIGLNKPEPWDGIRGPIPGPRPNTLDYKTLPYGDYVEAALASHFDSSAIAQTSVSEYVARTLTMAMVYEALGLTSREDKAKWTVLSFRQAAPRDPDLAAAVAAHGRNLNPQHTYRFEMIRHDGLREPHPDPQKFDRTIVPYTEHVLLFADPTIVLRQSPNKAWAPPYERTL